MLTWKEATENWIHSILGFALCHVFRYNGEMLPEWLPHDYVYKCIGLLLAPEQPYVIQSWVYVSRKKHWSECVFVLCACRLSLVSARIPAIVAIRVGQRWTPDSIKHSASEWIDTLETGRRFAMGNMLQAHTTTGLDLCIVSRPVAGTINQWIAR